MIPQTVWHSTHWCCIWWPCPALGYLASPGHSRPSPIFPGGSTVHPHSAKTFQIYLSDKKTIFRYLKKAKLFFSSLKNYRYTCTGIYNDYTFNMVSINFTELALLLCIIKTHIIDAFLFEIKNNSDCGFIIITLLLIKQDLTTCFHTGIINPIDLPTSSVRSVSSLLMVPVTVVTFEAREVIATSLQDHIKFQCKILLLQFTSC